MMGAGKREAGGLLGQYALLRIKEPLLHTVLGGGCRKQRGVASAPASACTSSVGSF